MNELNKKLLYWAGFREKDGIWFYPNGRQLKVFEEPELDLNACFKWLEPELYRRGLRYSLKRLQAGHLAEIFKPSKGWSDCVAYAVDEKPATAFCKAVEQLMEKK